ncbi:MAG: HupE/UreJ family protein [Alkalinema sp. RU_4_3]|nr:HupE/UreJ family protein [Alkalinema sp. RU_4_3]
MRKPLLQFAIALLLVLCTAFPSQAHWADLAVGDIRIGAQEAAFDLTIPTGLVGFADDNQDGKLSGEEVDRHQTELKKQMGEKIVLFNQKGEVGEWEIRAINQPSNIPSANNGTSHSSLGLQYKWPGAIEALTLRYKLFSPDASASRCLVTAAYQGKSQSLVFTPAQSEFNLIDRPLWQQVSSFAALGIEHILIGYDHILFLISLLLVGTNLKYLLKIVTAFTVSHSVTLSLAVLDVVSLPSQFVECAIALSIVYVAVENLWRKSFDHRWMLTFGFGLLHGLGFAGVLKEIQIPRSSLFASLASFNIGVEIGQVAIVLVCFFLLKLINKLLDRDQWRLYFHRLASGGIIVMGMVWLVERAFAIG